MVQIPSGGQTSTTGGEFLAHSEGSLSNRWLALIGGLTLQCCGGASYCFSLYSQALKTHLSYSQQLLDALGTAKDIGGNVGILSGLLYDVVPTWTVILVGALCTSLGFGMQWLALSGRISKPPFWQMAAFVFLAAQGATFFNTAVLVSNVSNFSGCRGIVLGLLKGYIGLSGALLSQLYLALYAPDQEGFLLLLTWLPILIAMLAMLVVHPIGSPAADQEEDASGGARWRFKLMYGVGGSLALFLMSAIILQHTVHINRKENVAIAVAMIALYSLHAIVLQRSRDEHTEQTHPAVLCILNNGQTQQTYDQQWQRPRSQSSKQGVREALLQTSREAAPSTSSSSSPSSSCRDESKRNHGKSER